MLGAEMSEQEGGFQTLPPPLGGRAAAGWWTRQTLTGTYANRHIKAYIHALVQRQMAGLTHAHTYTHTTHTQNSAASQFCLNHTKAKYIPTCDCFHDKHTLFY